MAAALWYIFVLSLLGQAASRKCSLPEIEGGPITDSGDGQQKFRLNGCTELGLDYLAGDSHPPLGDEGAFLLARALASPEGRKVAKLSLVGQSIGTAGAAELAETLKEHTMLSSLDLGDNPLGTAGTAILAEALQTNHILTSLFFVPEGDDTGAQAIVEALSCNSKVRYYIFHASVLLLPLCSPVGIADVLQLSAMFDRA